MFRFPIFNGFRVPRPSQVTQRAQFRPVRRRGGHFWSSRPPQYWSNPLTYRPPQGHVNNAPQRLPSALTNFKPKMLRGFEPLAALEGKSFESVVRNSEVGDAHGNYSRTSLHYSEIPLFQPTENNWNSYVSQRLNVTNPLFTDTISTISSSAGSGSESSHFWESSELSEDSNVIGDSSSDGGGRVWDIRAAPSNVQQLSDSVTAPSHNGDPTTRSLNPSDSDTNNITEIRFMPDIEPLILPAYDAYPYPEHPPPTYEEAILEAGGPTRYFLYEDENEALSELDNIIDVYTDTIETGTHRSTTIAPSTRTLDDLYYPGYGANSNEMLVNSHPNPPYECIFGLQASWFPEQFPANGSRISEFFRSNRSTDFFMY